VTNEGPHIDAGVDLSGRVAERPATLTGNATLLSNGTLRLDDLVLASGGNRLELAGSVGEELNLDGALDLRSAGATLPDAQGQGKGRVHITGTPTDPHVEGALRLTNLAFSDGSARTLEVDVRWHGEHDSGNALRLAASGLALSGVDANHLITEFSGSTERHTLTVDGDVGEIGLALRCSGSATADGDWSGRCSQLDLNPPAPLPHWRLEQPLALDWVSADQRVTLKPFCLRATDATACSRRTARMTPRVIEDLSLRVRDLPVALVGAWLPPEINLTGTLGLEVDVARQNAGPVDLAAQLSADDLHIETFAAGETIPFDLRDLAVTARSEASGFRLAASARAGRAGELRGTLALDQANASAGLAGEVSVANIDIGPLLQLVPGTLDGAGQLDGRVTLSGRADAPALDGEIALERARFAHEDLPEPIEELQLALRFAGADANFNGRLRTRAGAGDIDGHLHFAGDAWSAELGLRADELLVEPRQGTQIRVIPDITVTLDPTLARIAGRVQVPAAEVDLEHLPQSAVSVSSDTVIVGQAPAEPGIDYSVDLELLLGDRVHLRGLGADARLRGSLRLLREPGTALRGRGDVDIVSGRYNAYGQRLEITEGALLFRGPLTRPDLRITAVRRIEDEPVTVGVNVRGNAKEPQLKVFSQPTMPESRALYYLLTGRAPAAAPTRGSADGADNELALGSAMMQLGIAGAGKATGKVLGRLGIEDFQVDSRKVEGGTEVQLSGYLTPALYLRYGVSTFDRVNTLRLRYRVTPKIFIEAISGVESAVDVLYSFSR
jgi:translocation and assembly module TamB